MSLFYHLLDFSAMLSQTDENIMKNTRLLRKTRKQRIDDYVYELYKLDNTSFVIYVIENFLNRTFEILKYENTYETYEI